MTGTDTITGAPAAWYADPAGSPLLRWWDGATWTAHTVDPAAPAEPTLPTRVAAPAPVADPVESMAYVPMAGFGPAATTQRAPVAATYGEPTGSALTPWIWLMAAFPVLQVVAAVVLTTAVPDAPESVLRWIFFTAAVIANVALAGRDATLLARRGFDAPRTRWAVIPLVYFILRTVKVGRLSLWPLIVWAVTELLLVTLVVLAVLLPLFLAGRADAGYVDDGGAATEYSDATPLTSEERLQQLTKSGMEETLLRDFAAAGFGAESVACAPLTSTAPGSVALCVIDTETGRLEVNAEVTGADEPYTAFIVNGGRALD